MIKFIVVLLVTAATVAAASLLWPKFTTREKPAALQKVHDVVTETQVGREAATILGVASGIDVKPINFSTAVSTVAGAIVTTVEKTTQQIVTQQITTQLVSQYEHLPQPQQQQIQQLICKP